MKTPAKRPLRVTKADPTWLTGATMDTLTTKPSIRAAMAGLEQSLGLESGASYAWAAAAVMVGEITAAVFFLFRWSRAPSGATCTPGSLYGC